MRKYGLLLVAALLAVVAVGAAGLLAVWGTEPPSRAKYDQIQVGMGEAEVHQLLEPSSRASGRVGSCAHGRSRVEMWAMADGAFIEIDYDRNDNVKEKEYGPGDQSFTARVKRLTGRVYSP